AARRGDSKRGRHRQSTDVTQLSCLLSEGRMALCRYGPKCHEWPTGSDHQRRLRCDPSGMSDAERVPLLVGEIYVDFTITDPGSENKLRLGGIAHAARGFWLSVRRSAPQWSCRTI